MKHSEFYKILKEVIKFLIKLLEAAKILWAKIVVSRGYESQNEVSADFRFKLEPFRFLLKV